MIDSRFADAARGWLPPLPPLAAPRAPCCRALPCRLLLPWFAAPVMPYPPFPLPRRVRLFVGLPYWCHALTVDWFRVVVRLPHGWVRLACRAPCLAPCGALYKQPYCRLPCCEPWMCLGCALPCFRFSLPLRCCRSYPGPLDCCAAAALPACRPCLACRLIPWLILPFLAANAFA